MKMNIDTKLMAERIVPRMPMPASLRPRSPASKGVNAKSGYLIKSISCQTIDFVTHNVNKAVDINAVARVLNIRDMTCGARIKRNETDPVLASFSIKPPTTNTSTFCLLLEGRIYRYNT
jgi:hypothetical protein